MAGDDIVILAAGGIIIRETPAGEEVLLVHRKRYGDGHGDWTFPKGKLKKAESFQDAARREVHEETGCTVQLKELLGYNIYHVNSVPKVVLFWRVSLLEEGPPQDREEVAEVKWLPVSDALINLTYPGERNLLARAISTKTKSYKAPAQFAFGPWNQRWSWSLSKRTYDRLVREFQAFRIELALLEQRSLRPDVAWAEAAHDELANAKRYIEEKDAEGGWRALLAAQRKALFGLARDEMAMRAQVLREESQKLSSWRAKAIQMLLAVEDKDLTAERLTEAVALRDEYSGNQYYKILLVGDQLGVLLKLSGAALVGLLLALAFLPSGADKLDWRLIVAILLVGILGATFSAAQSLIANSPGGKIPERIVNKFVTVVRAVLGATAGLAGYLFLSSRLVNVTIADDSPLAGMAIAFVFGYAGERLIVRVLSSVDSGSGPS